MTRKGDKGTFWGDRNVLIDCGNRYMSVQVCKNSQNCMVKKGELTGFPGGSVVKNPPANAGNTGSSPGLGRSHMLRSS